MIETCHDCGETYEVVAQHWSQSDCTHPEPTQYQKEIITGLLMGDGCCTTVSKNPLVVVGMASPNYLKYVNEQFPVLGYDVILSTTADESADINERYKDNVHREEYSDIYEWRTKANPYFHKFQDWYESGKKVFPDDIKLTPTVLKHWYCGDGSTQKIGNYYKASISTVKERSNVVKIEDYFKMVGLPEPDWWTEHEMHWEKEHSREIFEYMGDPLPDFEYKWPDDW